MNDSRAGNSSTPLRCPHCSREMIVGTVGTSDSVIGHRFDVVGFTFRRNDGDDVVKIDRAQARGSDAFCEDCSTIVVKGRFAD